MSCLRLPILRLPHSFDDSSAPNQHFSVFTYHLWHGHEGDELLFIFLPSYSTGLSLLEAVSSVSRFYYYISAAPQFQSDTGNGGLEFFVLFT